jgi:type VI secretion system secreted protein Hcp
MSSWKRIAVVLLSILATAGLVVVFTGDKSPQEVLADGDVIVEDQGCFFGAFMTITGEQQGNIDGSVDAWGHEGTIGVFGLNHLVDAPFSEKTGELTGEPRHHYLAVTKGVDKASVKLYQALLSGERLSDVTVQFYRLSVEGAEEHYYTIVLTDAYIVSIEDSLPKNVGDGELFIAPMEEVAFVYKNIAWTWEPDGMDYNSDWVKTVKR